MTERIADLYALHGKEGPSRVDELRRQAEELAAAAAGAPSDDPVIRAMVERVRPYLGVEEILYADPELRNLLLMASSRESSEVSKQILRAVTTDLLRQVEERRRADRFAGERVGPLSPEAMLERYRDVAGVTIIDGVIPRVGTGATFGPSGQGKSTVLVLASLCMQAGVPFMGRAINEKVGTLFVAFEDGHEYGPKVMATAAALGLSTANLGIVVSPEPHLNVMSEASVEEFLAHEIEAGANLLAERGYRMGHVVIDTQRHTHQGKSINDDAATSLVTGLLSVISRRWQCFAQVVSHTPIADDGRVAGSGEQKGAKSLQLLINKGIVKIEKSRNGADGVIVGRFEVVPWTTTEWTGRDGTTTGVAREVSMVATAAARTALALLDKDDRTAMVALRIMSRYPDDDPDEIGWSANQLKHALKDVAERPVDSVDVWTGVAKVAEVLKRLNGEGLILNHADSEGAGVPLQYMTTAEGLALLGEDG